jgi:D-3-phosphoglycerate dehydrogenase
MGHFIWIIDDEWRDYEIEKSIIKKDLPRYGIKYSNHQYLEDFYAFGKEADGILVQIYIELPGEVIKELENCKVISVYGGGYDRVDIQAVKKKGIILTYVPNYCVEELSDHVIAFILYYARKLNSFDEFHKKAQEGFWGLKAVTKLPKRVRGSTLFIIGFGRIGKSVAKKAKLLGMELIVYDPYVPKAQIEKLGARKVGWEEGFRKADFVSVHIPLTKETQQLMGNREFSMMKKDAVFINTSRGKIVNEQALLKAVRCGYIAGAALDVVADEPPSSDREILNQEKILITPHIAYLSKESISELKRRATKNLVLALKSKKPRDAV